MDATTPPWPRPLAASLLILAGIGLLALLVALFRPALIWQEGAVAMVNLVVAGHFVRLLRLYYRRLLAGGMLALLAFLTGCSSYCFARYACPDYVVHGMGDSCRECEQRYDVHEDLSP